MSTLFRFSTPGRGKAALAPSGKKVGDARARGLSVSNSPRGLTKVNAFGTGTRGESIRPSSRSVYRPASAHANSMVEMTTARVGGKG